MASLGVLALPLLAGAIQPLSQGAFEIGFIDLGMGKCLVGGRNPNSSYHWGMDYPNEGPCKESCLGSAQCYGYSSSAAGNCIQWEEPHLTGGGDPWGDCHCMIKGVVQPTPSPTTTAPTTPTAPTAPPPTVPFQDLGEGVCAVDDGTFRGREAAWISNAEHTSLQDCIYSCSKNAKCHGYYAGSPYDDAFFCRLYDERALIRGMSHTPSPPKGWPAWTFFGYHCFVKSSKPPLTPSARQRNPCASAMEQSCGASLRKNEKHCFDCALEASDNLRQHSRCTLSDLARFCKRMPWNDQRFIVEKQRRSAYCDGPAAPLPTPAACDAVNWDQGYDDPDFENPVDFGNCGSCRTNGKHFEMTLCAKDGLSYTFASYSDHLCTNRVHETAPIRVDTCAFVPSCVYHPDHRGGSGAFWSTTGSQYRMANQSLLTIV